MQDMAAGYKGPHKVVCNRNAKNLGITGHVNALATMARGDIFVIAAGDDISLPERCARIVEEFRLHPGAHCVFSNTSQDIDSDGRAFRETVHTLPVEVPIGPDIFIRYRRSVPGHSAAWRRTIFEVFGPMDTRSYSEDLIVPFRASLLGETVGFSGTLVQRRLHDGNYSRVKPMAGFRADMNWRRNKEKGAIINKIGIYHTLIEDIDRATSMRLPSADGACALRPEVARRLDEARQELRYYEAHNLARLFTAVAGIDRNISLLTLMRWLVQYDFPTLFGLVVPLLNKVTGLVVARRARGRGVHRGEPMIDGDST
jgi:hypothetical protein